MSSLQRTRSLRKPSALSSEQASKAAAPTATSRSNSPSRLPVKPQARDASTTAGAASTAGARSGRSVPAVLGRSASTSTRRNGTTAAPEPTRREVTSRCPPPASSNRRPATARPTSVGSVTATQSKRNSTLAQAQTQTQLHVRAKSTATSLSAATVLRPPSRNTSGATASRAINARGASPVDQTPSTPPAAVVKQSLPQPRLRPAFSTLQQHYSPVKSLAPKPLTSTFLAPPSPSKLPANIAASAETNKLQAELLQLHLLHRDAAPVDAQWQASARQKLQNRFTKLVEASREAADSARVGVERENILALRRWGSGSETALEEKIQLLGELFSGLWTLSEVGGRYSRVVRRFERWLDRVRQVEEARPDASDALLQNYESLFVGELDAPWRDECAAITCRLEGWRAQLYELDGLPAGQTSDGDGGAAGKYSLARMLAGARSLLQDMLAELRIMADLEREALAREDEWIERMNRDEEGAEDTPRAGAVWRLV